MRSCIVPSISFPEIVKDFLPSSPPLLLIWSSKTEVALGTVIIFFLSLFFDLEELSTQAIFKVFLVSSTISPDLWMRVGTVEDTIFTLFPISILLNIFALSLFFFRLNESRGPFRLLLLLLLLFSRVYL